MAEDVDRTTDDRWTGRRERADGTLTLPPGTRIGRYELLGVLGEGGFGITYRARDLELHREVAIKEYLPAGFSVRQADGTVLARSTQAADTFLWGRERFVEEARTLARLERAPGIVNVYDIVPANGTAYMVMAFVAGETLEQRLVRVGRLPQADIARLLFPLLDGLEQVHAAGFLHRDIKPANILLDADGRPTLIDFGAARVALQGRTQAMTAVYTPGYAAFEQFTSAKQGPWTDCYALGATLYHCVTGARPPSAADRMRDDSMVPAVAAGAGLYAPNLLNAIDAALRLREPERPQSIADWRRLLSEPSVAVPAASVTRVMAPPPGVVAAEVAAVRPSARPGRWALVAALAILCLAGGAGALWWSDVWRGPAVPSQPERARIDAEEAAWTPATAANTTEALNAYLAKFPSGRHAGEARTRIAEIERRAKEPQPRDCPTCPEMVRIPPGSFVMGSPAMEAGRSDDEGPQRRVAIAYAFSLGKHEVTAGEFAAFAQATGLRTAAGGHDPGFPRTDRHPVVNVSWDDARAYAGWLTITTGKRYRLPTEAEWEYAAKAGTTTARYWGEPHQDACKYANVDDTAHGCRDGYAKTAPVGSFEPNRFGLHDMLGNVSEWTSDCWNANYQGAPADGASWESGDCARRVLRGGSWVDTARGARAASRRWSTSESRSDVFGFRVARTD